MSALAQLLSGFVLAGGKSSRMGEDKAFLELAGLSLLSHALKLARGVCGTVKIVGEPARFEGYGEVVADIYAERGPLGGIHAALLNSQTELNLILGVDLPFISPGFLAYMASEPSQSEAVVVVPKAGGRLQPLCAIYRKGFAALAERALIECRNRIDVLFTEASVQVIEEQRIQQMGFDAAMFRNLNTRDEWESAKKEFESRRVHL